jgi:hypothetical protein
MGKYGQTAFWPQSFTAVHETLHGSRSLTPAERKKLPMHLVLSPVLIPLGAFAVAGCAIIAGVANETQKARIKADQRMAMIARGMSIDDIDRLLGKPGEDVRPPKDPLRSLSNARRAAIILIASGIGLMGFFLMLTEILHIHEILAGAASGLIPLAIGIGFLVDYNLQKRELSRFGLEAGVDLTGKPLD